MKDTMQDINNKLDLLTGQMGTVMARIKRYDDFKEDLALFSNDAVNEIITFLSGVEFHLRSGDLLFLLKKLFMNVGNLTRIMDQVQSVTELLEDVTPLSKDIFNDIIEKLHKLEEEGFFKYLEAIKDIFRKCNDTFSPEDVAGMGNGFISILKLANRLNKPEYIEKLEKIADIIENTEIKRDKKVSLLKIFKKLRSKRVMQNAGIAIDFINKI